MNLPGSQPESDENIGMKAGEVDGCRPGGIGCRKTEASDDWGGEAGLMERVEYRRHRAGPWIVAAAVLVVSGWGLTHGVPAEIPVSQDTVRDLVLAQQCRGPEGCPELGASTSVPELHQGTLWIRYLAMAERLGLDMQGVRGVTLLAAALSLAILAWLTARVPSLAGTGSGLAAGGLGLLFFALSPEIPEVQWNPALLPLPSVVLVAATIAVGLGAGRTGFALVAGHLLAGLALGLTVQLHPVSALAVPGVVVLLALRRPKRWPLVYGATLIMAAAPFVLSPEALVTIPTAFAAWGQGRVAAAESAAGTGILWGAVASLIALAGVAWVALGANGAGSGVGAKLSASAASHSATVRGASGVSGPGPAWSDGSGRRPRAWEGWVGAALGALPCGLLLVSAVLAGRGIPDRYVLPFVPAGAMLVTLVVKSLASRAGGIRRAAGAGGQFLELAGGLSRLAGGAVLVVSIVAQLPGPPDGRRPLSVYTFEEVAWMGDRLAEMGIRDLDGAVARIRGPGLFYLHSALTLHLPQGTTGATGGSSDAEAFRIVKLPVERDRPVTWRCRVGEERWAVCVVPFAESLRWETASVRFERGSHRDSESGEAREGPCGEGAPHPTRVGGEAREGPCGEGAPHPTRVGTDADGGAGLWQKVALRRDDVYSEPGFPELEGLRNESAWTVMRWRIPIFVATDGPILLLPSGMGGALLPGGDGVSLRGLDHRVAPDGRMVVVSGGQKGKGGMLELAWSFEHPNRFVGKMLPDVLEVDLHRDDALALLEAAAF